MGCNFNSATRLEPGTDPLSSIFFDDFESNSSALTFSLELSELNPFFELDGLELVDFVFRLFYFIFYYIFCLNIKNNLNFILPITVSISSFLHQSIFVIICGQFFLRLMVEFLVHWRPYFENRLYFPKRNL